MPLFSTIAVKCENYGAAKNATNVPFVFGSRCLCNFTPKSVQEIKCGHACGAITIIN